jgi:YggT family protein
VIADIIDVTILVLTIAIIVRALLSWFPNVDPRNPLVEFIITITEPILAPIRSVMPRMGMFDLTPMIAIILLQVIREIILSNVR